MESPSNPVAATPVASSPFRRPPQPTSIPVVTATPLSVSTAGPVSGGRDDLERQRRKGALWLYWVAGLSLINSIAALAGHDTRFVIGLGTTRVADSLAARSGNGWTAAALLDLMLIAAFVFLGRCATQGQLWALLLGVTLYAADGVIFLVVRDWIGVGFHVFVLVMMFRGLQAGRQLETHS